MRRMLLYSLSLMVLTIHNWSRLASLLIQSLPFANSLGVVHDRSQTDLRRFEPKSSKLLTNEQLDL